MIIIIIINFFNFKKLPQEKCTEKDQIERTMKIKLWKTIMLIRTGHSWKMTKSWNIMRNKRFQTKPFLLKTQIIYLWKFQTKLTCPPSSSFSCHSEIKFKMDERQNCWGRIKMSALTSTKFSRRNRDLNTYHRNKSLISLLASKRKKSEVHQSSTRKKSLTPI